MTEGPNEECNMELNERLPRAAPDREAMYTPALTLF